LHKRSASCPGRFITWQRAPSDREQGASSASPVEANGTNPTSVRKRMSFSQPAVHHSTDSTSAPKKGERERERERKEKRRRSPQKDIYFNSVLLK